MLSKSTFGLSRNQYLVDTAKTSATQSGVIIHFAQLNEIVEIKSPDAATGAIGRWRGPGSSENVRSSSLLAYGDGKVLPKSGHSNAPKALNRSSPVCFAEVIPSALTSQC